MSKKFIPNGDSDFRVMASSFAAIIAKGPARFGVTQADCDALGAAVENFIAKYQSARWGDGRGTFTSTRAKDESRREAEQIIRRLANQIRSNHQVDAISKAMLKLRMRPEKARSQPVPVEPPRLKFVGARHQGGGSVPVHELEFREFQSWSKARPAGAARIELFVDLVEPDAPIPAHPGANLAGRAWYLRSYTRNPIILTPPMARVPMRVVYWARWADSAGNVGPFSATAAGWVEGGSHLPALAPMQEPLKLLDPSAGREGRDQMVVVAVLEAQYQSLHAAAAMLDSARAAPRALPEAPPEPRQLEGPANERDQAAESREAA